MIDDALTRCDDAAPCAPREARIDFSRLPSLDSLERTPTGGVRVRANIGRSGVLLYRRADGSTRREYRPDSEAFAPRSLASASDAVVTVGHPPDALVTPATVRQHQVGHVRGDASREGKYITAQLAVLDAAAIGGIGAGKLVELSSGYTCAFDPTPGMTPEGEPYDGVQRDVLYNHVALLPAGAGRAGPDVKLRFDGAEVRLEAADPETETRNDAMKEFINGREYTVGTPEWSAANALRMKRLDELEAAAKESDKSGEDFKSKLDALTKERDTMKAELDATKAKVDELTKKLGESCDETKMDAMVAERASVLDVARRVLGPDAKLDGKTNDALRREVVTKLDGAAALLDGDKPRSPELVRAYLDARIRSLPQTSSAPRVDTARTGTPAPFDVAAQYTPPGRR